jgi:signal transduction histidine kinase
VGTANGVCQRAAGGLVADPTIVLIAQVFVGPLLGFLLGVYDVQRTLTSERLLEERETATRFSRRLNVLNRVLRHDIRNKVNVIRGNADLVAAGSGETETAADTIRKQADEMFQLSEYARELQAVMDQEDVATEALDAGTSVAAKAMRLRRDYPHATVNQNVADVAWADASPFVDSAIENLLANAIEHNDADSPTVWVDVEVDDEEGVLAIRIADDGPGIPEAEVAVLQRGRETSLEHASGLGLWLVHWIVTESGGSVSFEEREPRGSVVELTLPLADPPDEAKGADSRDDDGSGEDEPGDDGDGEDDRVDAGSG